MTLKMQILVPAHAAVGERWSVTCMIAAHEDALHHLGIEWSAMSFISSPPTLSSTYNQVLKPVAAAGVVAELSEKEEFQQS